MSWYMRLFLIICANFTLFWTLAVSAETRNLFDTQNELTLEECFKRAIQNTETLKISEAEIAKARITLTKTIEKMLPALSFEYSALWSDRTSNPLFSSVVSNEAVTQTGAFVVSMPAFSGWREWATLKGASHVIDQKKALDQKQRLNLLNDVASAYFSLMIAGENEKASLKILSLYQKRYSELKAREKVGRSRIAERLSVEAQIATLSSQNLDIVRTKQLAINLLSFLVGTPLEKLKIQNQKEDMLEPLSYYYSKMFEHPESIEQQKTVEIAKQAIEIAHAEHLPHFNLSGQRHANFGSLSASSKWDATLGIEIPLWSWGSINHAVMETKSDYYQALENQHYVKRSLKQKIKDLYDETYFLIKKNEIENKVITLTQKSFELSSQDYENGLVSNLEVMDALDKLQQAEQSAVINKFKVKLNLVKLNITSGHFNFSE